MFLRHRFRNCWKMVDKLLCKRRCTLTKALMLMIIVTVLCSLIFLTSRDHHPKVKARVVIPPVPHITCKQNKDNLKQDSRPQTAEGNFRIRKRVLIIAESLSHKSAKRIAVALESARFDYKVESAEQSLPSLTHMDKGRFGVIIFESIQLYLILDYWNRQLLDKYCREYDVGMLFFVKSPDDYGIGYEKLQDFPLTLQYNLAIKDYTLNSKSDVWQILRPGEVIEDRLPLDDWTAFYPNHSTYEPLSFAKPAPPFYEDSEANYSVDNRTLYPALRDLGLYDGIRRIFFGNSLAFWLHHPMLMDSLSYLSRGRLSLSLDRYMQVDIDDIFVGAVGTRFRANDVEELVRAQSRLQERVDGFHFMLGFSGWYYLHGNDEEDAGDRKILEYRDRFYWFPHMWRHEQAHKCNEADLVRNMEFNYNFAKDNHIPVKHQYAVAPHHSGVYPVHEPLYTSWKKVWDIRVTSTEEYPKLYPSWGRRGFIHKGLMVLPRQTCGLFTHTIFLDTYPGGSEKLDSNIQGGELFQSFLYNPVSIYMTHLSNYGNDRLALYMFESAIKFVQCWTNLELKQVTPVELAIKYFDMFPEEEVPIWKNPCDYKRHLSIWSANKTCARLPKLLVIGPQKTGTTALYTFLNMHPMVKSNFNSKDTFEEVQFFNGRNYANGLDWYMEQFPLVNVSAAEVLFEKSANYFDNADVPRKAHALLPNARLVCILLNPAKRAYSWYQHMRAHNDETAMNFTFHQIITAPETSPKYLRELRNRCLNPGMYAEHLYNWLNYYSARQLFIIDGDHLKSDPADVMDRLQKYLHIEPYYDYASNLKFDPDKGFYCQVSGDQTKCLGQGKGRKYPFMDAKSEDYLHQFYSNHNAALQKLLEKINSPIPDWLAETQKVEE